MGEVDRNHFSYDLKADEAELSGGERRKSTCESSNEQKDDSGNASVASSYYDTPIPDGTLRGWLQILSGFMLYFNSWGMVTAFGIFQLHYSNVMLRSESNSSISWIGTIQGFLLAVGSVFAGCILDRGHPRRLIAFGGFFAVLGLMMTSLCTTYWQIFLAQGVCIGLGSGSLFIVAVAVIPGWFEKRRAIATGLAATGSSIGGVVYPITFHKLEPMIGFGWSLRVMGFMALATCAISFACANMRTLPPPRPKIVDFSGFREILFTLFAIVSFIGAMGLYVPFFYITEYSLKRGGITGELVYFMLPILSAGSILGRVLPAFLADRYGCLTVLTFTTAISSIVALVWIAVTGQAGVIVWSLLYGAFSGTFVSLQTPTIAAITPDLRLVGGRMGMNNFCLALGVLVGNPVAGAIGGSFKEESRWIGMQVFTGLCLAVAAMLVGITWHVKAKRDRASRKEDQ
ncbi:uncharacterized protein MYCFIDRAFT_26691 [Pseudocercospora fijiensis CIRAD86]|uniref:Major facilitator superfamily (MFS) profile domain-containing protein n=1 Tax=Pseudocercospora fijiensis (strain CIRAD86) TaxID=383855 RepID=M2ZPG8_PSEFD|nr:uncharacterized protein MYCFIDRAFT_26691 [Pseudocercospora fijiensis CIRAD86]EME80989.1 hypothetical protein MYCFIDRAFT_26691 [Pseudocercospora fijiensis CIRAD86]